MRKFTSLASQADGAEDLLFAAAWRGITVLTALLLGQLPTHTARGHCSSSCPCWILAHSSCNCKLIAGATSGAWRAWTFDRSSHEQLQAWLRFKELPGHGRPLVAVATQATDAVTGSRLPKVSMRTCDLQLKLKRTLKCSKVRALRGFSPHLPALLGLKLTWSTTAAGKPASDSTKQSLNPMDSQLGM